MFGAMNIRHRDSGLVYSTEAGRMCPGCARALAQCSCRAAAPPPEGDGIVRVSRQTQGRGGKAVTLADLKCQLLREPDDAYSLTHTARLRLATVTRQIADVKSKLQRTDPLKESTSHRAQFAELTELEMQRKKLLTVGLG